MARPLRVAYPGALYHVIARGNARQDIFIDDRDRSRFLYWLEDVISIHHLVCHAFCLMNNHYHLLIETPEANLSAAMRDLNGHYTQAFNARHTRVGHLLQGRYKSFVIEKELYLLEVARYIVLNPVRAKMVRRPQDWKWSSYGASVGRVPTPVWLHTDWILNFFGSNRQEARGRYRQFVSDGIAGEDPYEDVKNGFLLGSPQFVHWIWEEKTKGIEGFKEYLREERIVGRPTLDELFAEAHSKQERDRMIALARFRCGYLASEIARHLGLGRSVVGKISRGMRKTMTLQTSSIFKIPHSRPDPR